MKKTDITVDQFISAEIINMNDRKIHGLHNNASKQLTILYFLKSSVTSESRFLCKVLFVFCILELVFFAILESVLQLFRVNLLLPRPYFWLA